MLIFIYDLIIGKTSLWGERLLEWSKLFLTAAVISCLLAFLLSCQLWRKCKKLKVGDTLTNEWVNEFIKKGKFVITLGVIGCILYIIGVLIKL